MKPQESFVYNPKQVQELKKLVSTGEGNLLEFKRKASYPEKIIREMIAFANTNGGILLVGVSDNGDIPGLKYPEDESHVLLEALKQVRPALLFNETFIPLGDNMTVLRYDIPESKKKPHYILGDNRSKDSFVRVEDKSIQASRELREIIKRKQRHKDIRFRYGEHEHFLMKYLESNKTITLKEFVKESGLKRFYASNKLILLVLANVLRIIPTEKGDLYTLAFGKF
ncbi:MAG: ATP-binding protein [Marivirga sp.]|nr:ATP-binding protein [Marivirga sp.]